jgi:hypothetical protein
MAVNIYNPVSYYQEKAGLAPVMAPISDDDKHHHHADMLQRLKRLHDLIIQHPIYCHMSMQALDKIFFQSIFHEHSQVIEVDVHDLGSIFIRWGCITHKEEHLHYLRGDGNLQDIPLILEQGFLWVSDCLFDDNIFSIEKVQSLLAHKLFPESVIHYCRKKPDLEKNGMHISIDIIKGAGVSQKEYEQLQDIYKNHVSDL